MVINAARGSFKFLAVDSIRKVDFSVLKFVRFGRICLKPVASFAPFVRNVLLIGGCFPDPLSVRDVMSPSSVHSQYGEDKYEHDPDDSSSPKGDRVSRRGILPKDAINVMKTWLFQHIVVRRKRGPDSRLFARFVWYIMATTLRRKGSYGKASLHRHKSFFCSFSVSFNFSRNSKNAEERSASGSGQKSVLRCSSSISWGRFEIQNWLRLEEVLAETVELVKRLCVPAVC